MKFTLHIWRQSSNSSKGSFKKYTIDDISPDSSFLEMLDILNEMLTQQDEEPVAFDYDCREGICGMCSLMINGNQRPVSYIFSVDSAVKPPPMAAECCRPVLRDGGAPRSLRLRDSALAVRVSAEDLPQVPLSAAPPRPLHLLDPLEVPDNIRVYDHCWLRTQMPEVRGREGGLARKLRQ